MGNGGTDIVDKLLFNELLAVPDAVKHFAHRNRRDGMLADKAEAGLIFRRRRVFHPEHAEFFNALAKTGRFNRRQAVMHVMQKMFIKAELAAHRIEQLRREIEIFLGGPELLFRPVAFGRRLVGQPFPFGHAVGGFHARHAALHADRSEAHLFMPGVIFQHVVNSVPGGVAVDHDPFPGRAAQQLIQGHVGGFGFNVPQRHIHRGDGRHGDRAATPVGAFIEKLPDIFNAVRIAANQLGAKVILQVRGHGQLASVQRGIAQTDDPLIGGNF